MSQASAPILAPTLRAPSARTRSAALTWLAGAMYTIVTLLVGLITTPLLLKFLGTERLGANRAAGEWMGYLILADLGMGAAIAVMLVRAQGWRDEIRKIGIVKFALRLFMLLSIISAVIGLVLAWYMPRLIHGVPDSMTRELRIAALIGAVGLLISPFNVFRSVLEAEQRGYLVHIALLVQSICISVLAVFLAWRGFGLIGQSLALVIGAIIFAALTTRFALRGKKGFAHHARAKISTGELVSLSWPLALSSLGVRLNVMTDSIVTGFLLGPAMVTTLFITQRLVQLAGQQVNSIVNASWAALADLRATGEHDAFASRVCELARLIVGVGLTLTGTIAAYNHHFVRLWVGNDHFGGDALSILAMLASVLVGFTLLFARIIDAHGDTEARVKVSIIGAILNLALSIIFARQMGLKGILLGTVVAESLTNVWYCPLIVIRKYHVRAGDLLRSIRRGLAYAIPWMLAAWIYSHTHVIETWPQFSLELAIAGSLSLAYCWKILLTQPDRDRWKLRIARKGFAS